MRPRSPITLSLLAAVALAVSACGSSGGAHPTSSSSLTAASGATQTTAPGGSSAPPQVEVNPPGDIPDNQAFVPYRGALFTVTVPEGWARTQHGSSVVFADKYNSITVDVAAARSAPTVDSVRSTELPTIRSHATGYVGGAVTSVTRTSGPAVLATYRAQSPVNPVTGKVTIQAVERYEFWRSGHTVALTLAAPVGSDNVDPWRKVTDSFSWTGR